MVDKAENPATASNRAAGVVQVVLSLAGIAIGRKEQRAFQYSRKTIEKLMDCKIPCSPSPKTLAFSQHAACQATEIPSVELTVIEAVTLE